MQVSYSNDALRTVIDDMDRATWLNGPEMYYKLPKDYRPEINPFDLEDALQAYYQLTKVVGRKTSDELNTELDNLHTLAVAYVDYCNHVLGRIIEDQYRPSSKEEA